MTFSKSIILFLMWSATWSLRPTERRGKCAKWRTRAEAARAALAPYFEILRSTIKDHAGTVVKFTGDGVLAIFGVPEVAEDDALRAVAAGLELQQRFRAFADSVRDQHGVELGMRVGINTGELVTGDGDADLVFGTYGTGLTIWINGVF